MVSEGRLAAADHPYACTLSGPAQAATAPSPGWSAASAASRPHLVARKQCVIVALQARRVVHVADNRPRVGRGRPHHAVHAGYSGGMGEVNARFYSRSERYTDTWRSGPWHAGPPRQEAA